MLDDKQEYFDVHHGWLYESSCCLAELSAKRLNIQSKLARCPLVQFHLQPLHLTDYVHIPLNAVRIFEISNQIVTYYSIRNWCNYSKLSNTYLTVISWGLRRALFVLCQPQAPALTVIETSAAPYVCAYPSHSPDHRTGAAAGAILDRDTWSRYNGGRQMQRTVSWALAFLSVLLLRIQL